ncbi:MAG: MBL fold metallo-hydrolase [Gemmatimonadetes bacterium]|nr:MBL fold metallo-hydrolase [Gemmatimonadota bacterium]
MCSLVALCALGVLGAFEPLAAEDFEFEQLTETAFAALASSEATGNATVFRGTDAVLLVDSHIVPELARTVISEIGYSGASIRYLVNTHWHADHSHGNAAYVENARGAFDIVAHDMTAEGFRERANEQLAMWPGFYGRQIAEHEDALANTPDMSAGERSWRENWVSHAQLFLAEMESPQFAVPTLTVRDRLEVDLGGLRLEILHAPGHTDGDLVVWDPVGRVLAAGDLILGQVFIGTDSPTQYRETLERMRDLNPRLIVPGHGPVMQGPDILTGHIDALNELMTATEAAVAEGLSLEATQERLGTQLAGGRLGNLPALIERAFQEVSARD